MTGIMKGVFQKWGCDGGFIEFHGDFFVWNAHGNPWKMGQANFIVPSDFVTIAAAHPQKKLRQTQLDI